ncbi:conserved Plasmodium protein, unknown function [Plasmodium ovale]|uniref:Uncharacterized protein n=2 Tax=Plasmodium ovale TaxID=36330 RepID=A0A1A8X1N9_PLAOA|nr:hypothetical protein POVCU2_0046800 [Plasmodium ovale curtisi]SBS98081.1 hypothetical protein POVCU1_043340 [Plasmodium ovale curtisi]SCQ16832.1 conserved Plasmodium protein, unknown function [Plasmodium ovale]
MHCGESTGGSGVFQGKTTGRSFYGDKKKEGNSFDEYSENYNFLLSSDTIGGSFKRKEEKKRREEEEYKKIMESSDEKSDYSYDNRNTNTHSDWSNNFSSDINKAERKNSPFLTHQDDSFERSSTNLEENIFKNLESKSSHLCNNTSDMEKTHSVIINKEKSKQRRNSYEEDIFNTKKSTSIGKINRGRSEGYYQGEDNLKIEQNGITGRAVKEENIENTSGKCGKGNSKEHISCHFNETEKTGLWLVDTINELLDKLSDMEKRDSNTESFEIEGNNLPNDNMVYEDLNQKKKGKWCEYLKLNNIIYHSHILPIYESIREIFIKYQMQKMEEKKKKKKKSSTILSLPKFPYKNLKDRCISKTYKNLPHLNGSNERVRMMHRRGTLAGSNNYRVRGHHGGSNEYDGEYDFEDYDNNNGCDGDDGCDDACSYSFVLLVHQIKQKYKEFCDKIGEKLGTVDKENYNFREYCMVLSKMLATNIKNMIPFSKFPLFLNNMVNYVQACSQQCQHNESIKSMHSMDPYRLHVNSRMETIYTLPVNLGNSLPNLNSTISLNDPYSNGSSVQRSNYPLFAAMVSTRQATGEGDGRHHFAGASDATSARGYRRSFSTYYSEVNRGDAQHLSEGLSQEERNNMTSKFTMLPRYMKTYANSRSKIRNSFRTIGSPSQKQRKGNFCASPSANPYESPFANMDPLEKSKTNHIPEKNVERTASFSCRDNHQNEEANANARTNSNTNEQSTEGNRDLTTIFPNDSFNRTSSDNYCTAKSLPLNESIKFGNSPMQAEE